MSIQTNYARTDCRCRWSSKPSSVQTDNVGGNVIEQAGQWSVVRGVGLIQSVGDVENIVLTAQNGIPIYVKNVANVKLGDAFRQGALDKNGKEAVGGVVIARYGVNTLEVIDAIKQKIAAIQSGLPKGVQRRSVLRPHAIDPTRHFTHSNAP